MQQNGTVQKKIITATHAAEKAITATKSIMSDGRCSDDKCKQSYDVQHNKTQKGGKM